MRLLTYTELGRTTKIELETMLRQILAALPELPEGSIDRDNALLNIQHIRLFLKRFTPYPMP